MAFCCSSPSNSSFDVLCRDVHSEVRFCIPTPTYFFFFLFCFELLLPVNLKQSGLSPLACGINKTFLPRKLSDRSLYTLEMAVLENATVSEILRQACLTPTGIPHS